MKGPSFAVDASGRDIWGGKTQSRSAGQALPKKLLGKSQLTNTDDDSEIGEEKGERIKEGLRKGKRVAVWGAIRKKKRRKRSGTRAKKDTSVEAKKSRKPRSNVEETAELRREALKRE